MLGLHHNGSTNWQRCSWVPASSPCSNCAYSACWESVLALVDPHSRGCQRRVLLGTSSVYPKISTFRLPSCLPFAELFRTESLTEHSWQADLSYVQCSPAIAWHSGTTKIAHHSCLASNCNWIESWFCARCYSYSASLKIEALSDHRWLSCLQKEVLSLLCRVPSHCSSLMEARCLICGFGYVINIQVDLFGYLSMT